MKITELFILDQVNVRFTNLDPKIRRLIREELKFFQGYAVHTPAYKAGRWDGNEYLFDVGGRTYLNLIDKVLPILIDNGWMVEINDQRLDYEFEFPKIDSFIFADKSWPKGHKHEGESIILMEHQIEALNNFFQNLQCCQELPTSSGKTLITAAQSYFCEPFGRSLVIVPNKSLVIQTEEDYKNLGLDVGVYFGDRKELGRTHTICTWQILHVLDKKSKKSEEDRIKFLELLRNIKCVIIDEVHGAKAKALKQLLSGPLAHVPIRWGLTGTIPKDPYDFAIIKSMLGPVTASIEPEELQKKGVLSNCEIEILQLKDNVQFRSYIEEHDFLVYNEKRLDWISKKTFSVTQTYGNTLLLVNRIKTGEELNALISGSIFISGTMDVKKRKEYYDAISEQDNQVIIATYGVAAIGINVPRLFNIILFEPGKSFIRVIQTIGRGLRVAKDKNFVRIYDICSDCKYSKRHLTERKKYYKEKKYPFNIEKINYRGTI